LELIGKMFNVDVELTSKYTDHWLMVKASFVG
jgi:hypothetical protein